MLRFERPGGAVEMVREQSELDNVFATKHGLVLLDDILTCVKELAEQVNGIAVATNSGDQEKIQQIIVYCAECMLALQEHRDVKTETLKKLNLLRRGV